MDRQKGLFLVLERENLVTICVHKWVKKGVPESLIATETLFNIFCDQLGKQ